MDPADHLRGNRHGPISLMMTDAKGRARIFRSTVAFHIDNGLVGWWGEESPKRAGSKSSNSTTEGGHCKGADTVNQPSEDKRPKFQPLRKRIASLDPFVGCGRIHRAVSTDRQMGDRRFDFPI